MESLADALPKEQARCRELVAIYLSLGPVGLFGAAMINNALKRAEEAVMSGDVVAMIAAYQELKEFKE